MELEETCKEMDGGRWNWKKPANIKTRWKEMEVSGKNLQKCRIGITKRN